MARLNFTAIAPTDASGAKGIALEDIPEDVRLDIEEVYATMKQNPALRMRTPEFGSKQEALGWQTLAAAYCAVRPGGAIAFRRSPTRGLPETQFDFRVTDIKDNGTSAVNQAVEAAKAAAKK